MAGKIIKIIIITFANQCGFIVVEVTFSKRISRCLFEIITTGF
jgi:hypothetical protein